MRLKLLRSLIWGPGHDLALDGDAVTETCRRETIRGQTTLLLREWPGSGQPFVLLHGLASNSLTWAAVASLLSQAGHRVIAYDQRGHGRSDKPATGYGFDDVCADLEGLVEVCQVHEPILVGQSWGGNVVLEFAAHCPRQARGLGLVDGGFLDLHGRPGATWESVARDLRPPDLRGMLRERLARMIREMHPQWTEEGAEATLANMETLPDQTVRPWLSLEHHLEILRALWEQRPAQLYPRVAEPVLICAAEASGSPNLEQKRKAVAAAAEALSRCQVVWFPATDHDIHIHRPRELANLFLTSVREGIWS
jgi:pimeloyl-ACP methyl ester carboxylesterase